MEFTINLQIDCTDRLEMFVTGLLSKVFTPQTRTQSISAPEAPATEQKAIEPTPEAPAAPVVTEAPAPEVKPAAASDAITDEEVRDAFHACKVRLLGTNPDANPDKKKVVRKAKEYLKSIGAENLASIPQDKRKEFLDFCEIMTIEDGNSEQPF